MATWEVKTLLNQHAVDIRALRSLCTPEDLFEEKYVLKDDLFLLRYLLSNKTVQKAYKSLVIGAEYRRKFRHVLGPCGEHRIPDHLKGIALENSVVGLHDKPLVDGPEFPKGTPGLVLFSVRVGLMDPVAMASNHSKDIIVEIVLFSREQMFLSTDHRTRMSGKIYKSLAVQDLTNGSMVRALRSRSFTSAFGEVSKMADDLYPQMNHKMLMYNPPSAMRYLMKIVKTIMSKKSAEKLAVCPGKSAGSIDKCPFLRKTDIDTAIIPTYLGGGCDCDKPGCISGVSNDVAKYKDFKKVIAATPRTEDGWLGKQHHQQTEDLNRWWFSA